MDNRPGRKEASGIGAAVQDFYATGEWMMIVLGKRDTAPME